MSLPAAITKCTVTFGSALTLFGDDVAMKVKVTPTHDLVWAATGQPLISFFKTVEAAAGLPGSFEVPHTDQAGFRNAAGAAFTGWAYQVEITYTGPGGTRTATKPFQPVTGQDIVDLDLVPGGSISVPVSAPAPAVTSVNGQTGAVVVAGGDSGAVSSVNGQVGTVVLDAAGVGAVGTGDARMTDTRTPTDGTVTNAKVAAGAAISLDKTADSGTRLAMTAAERTKLNASPTTADVNTAADTRIAAAAGVSVASLVAGKVPASQIPAIALTTTQTAASQSAMLALTTQEGDVVVRTDEHKSYIRNSGVAGTMADFTLLDTPTDAVTTVAGKIGTVTLVKGDVGLGNVDNTADSAKSVASAAVLTTARTINGVSFNGSANISLVKGDIGLGNVDNTSDANKPVSTATQTALNAKVATGMSFIGYGTTLPGGTPTDGQIFLVRDA